MFEAIERGEIKALWVMATNPAVSLPRAGAMREALKRLELFIVSENVLSNDTVKAGAHVLLPAAAWGEKDGTVTNSERRIPSAPFLAFRRSAGLVDRHAGGAAHGRCGLSL
jgi:assimilatory nitrate reductase catalytic subunit